MLKSNPPKGLFSNTLGGLNGGLEIVGGLESSADSQVIDSLIVRQSAACVWRTWRTGAYALIRQSATLLREAVTADKPRRISQRHGFGSTGMENQIGTFFEGLEDKSIKVFYLGDHDVSGHDIERDRGGRRMAREILSVEDHQRRNAPEKDGSEDAEKDGAAQMLISAIFGHTRPIGERSELWMQVSSDPSRCAPRPSLKTGDEVDHQACSGSAERAPGSSRG